MGSKSFEIGRYLSGANHTVNLLVGADGVKCCSVINVASNTNEFVQFFVEATNAYTDDGEPAFIPGDVVIVDNAPFHHYEAEVLLTNWFDDLGIELVYLPTYSPDLNPVENCFNKLKTLLKRDHYREILHDNVAVAVYDAVSLITPAETRHFFVSTQYIDV